MEPLITSAFDYGLNAYNFIEHHTLVHWAVGLFGGGFITRLTSNFLELRAESLVVMLFGGFPIGKKPAKGLWYSRYDYRSEDEEEPQTSEHIFVFRQFGKRITARSLLKTGENSEVTLSLIEDMESVFTGRWAEKTSKGYVYYGAIQLHMNTVGSEMDGSWVGFDRKAHINRGRWVFVLVSKTDSKKDRLAALKSKLY